MGFAVIIPSLDPDENFIDIVKGLCPDPEHPVIVVDDGSKEELKYIFRRIGEIPFCDVLTHDVNHGQGRALKTAFAYYKEHYPRLLGVVIGDCDGQHSLEDFKNVMNMLASQPDSIILGVRDFTGDNVPAKSRFGNRFNYTVFNFLYGGDATDTQTGLRGFPTGLIDWLLHVKGERFEYMTYMLTQARIDGIGIKPVPIETIYINENAGSHYRVVIDSIRVLPALFGPFFKLWKMTLTGFVIDLAAFVFLYLCLSGFSMAKRLLLATVLAWAAALAVTFILKRVTRLAAKKKRSGNMLKPLALNFVLMLVLLGLLFLFAYALGWNLWAFKVILGLCLILVSVKLQMKLFYHKNPVEKV